MRITLPTSNLPTSNLPPNNLEMNNLATKSLATKSLETSNLPLRLGALAAAGSGTLFWIYTFYAIAQLPGGDGTGMRWVAAMPLGAIFVSCTLPALILALRGRGGMLVLSNALGAIGLAAFAWLWFELIKEFAG